jgi:hypothetical protein
MHTAAFDLWQQHPEFTIPNQGIASNQGDVQRLERIDKFKHSRDEFIAFKVRQVAQLGIATQMRRIECVASGTAQGAFFCDLD